MLKACFGKKRSTACSCFGTCDQQYLGDRALAVKSVAVVSMRNGLWPYAACCGLHRSAFRHNQIRGTSSQKCLKARGVQPKKPSGMYKRLVLSTLLAASALATINGPVITQNFPDPSILTVGGTTYVVFTLTCQTCLMKYPAMHFQQTLGP